MLLLKCLICCAELSNLRSSDNVDSIKELLDRKAESVGTGYQQVC
jgi:hypothetical protein